ncbi:MAG: YceI family protein [Bacteroidota bacterium]
MKKLFYPVLAAILLVGSAWTLSTSLDKLKVVEGYSIAFKSKDPSGTFKKMKGDIQFDESDLASCKFDLSFEVSSISTGNGMQNKKALTAEWFDAAKYPQITFVSTKVEKSDNTYYVTGNLKMKGVTKEYKIPVTASKKGTGFTFTGKFKVNRIDFKVGKKSDVVPSYMEINYSMTASK